MAKIYGFRKFSYPVTERVVLNAKPTVTNAANVTSARGYTTVMGLSYLDVGCIIDCANNAGTVLAEKPNELATDHQYYLLAEVPVPADDSDYQFVGIPLTTMADINNLIERRPQQDWATQFYNLRKEGAK
jgi:hypothetical protein